MLNDSFEKAIDEIRRIRERITEENKDLSSAEHAEKMNRIAAPIAKRLGLKTIGRRRVKRG
jgi:response regulator RpfG family c-di-GMP phosphodiesterase